MTNKIKEEDKNLWNHTRVGFYTMISMFILSMFLSKYYETNGYVWFSIGWVIVTIFTFICSIRHLNKYKQKRLAITSLIISGILTVLFIIAFVAGMIGA